MSTVCLAVMAKNEAHVIARCLASARPLVTSWLVLDTGSSDATIAAAREAMASLPGDAIAGSWRGFSESRNELLELARPRADYTLVLDADDVLEYAPNTRFPELTDPGYALVVHDGTYTYLRVHLFKSTLPWRYEGICHEAAVCDGVGNVPLLDGIVYRRIGGGARSLAPDTYERDAALLEEDLRRDPTNARGVFYLARSYEDAGDLSRALAQYERRALMGGLEEEVFYALFSAARVRERLRLPRERVASAYLEAWNVRPHRAEPLYQLALLAQEAEDWARVRSFAAAAMAIPFPRADLLFVHHEVYAWRALDTYAAACAKLGDWGGAIEACRKLLARYLPGDDRERIAANLASCEAALALASA